MKKRLLISACVLLFAFSLQAQEAPHEITIKGKVQFLNPAAYARLNKVWLSKRQGWSNKMLDSVNIAPDGSWQLTIKQDHPSIYSVDIAKWDRVTVYSDSDITVHSRGYDTAKVKIKNPPYVFVEGSDDNNFINLVDHAVYRNYQTMIAVSKEMYYAGLEKDKDSAWASYLKEKNPYQQLDEDFKDRLEVLIRAYKNRPVVLYGLGMLNWEKDSAIIMPILAYLNKHYPWFTDAAEMQKDMKEKLAQARMLRPGNPVPAVSYPDASGKKQGLEQFKGKYLLIDFWASWCGPCRAAVPKVKKLYAQYKKDGFEVVSISIDENKDAWKKAMAEEKMPWTQLWSPDMNATMHTFLFSAIPTLYLIDKEGKIVGSFTGYGESVENKVKAWFNKN